MAPLSEWSPELVVDADLAHGLISDQFPAALGELHLLGEGWDSTVWRSGPTWVFRFPRREVGLAGFERERTALPRLAERLPAAVPVAELRGVPGRGFPWQWLGSRWIPGHELHETDADKRERTALAAGLGRFLRALHGVDAAEFADLPVDVVSRSDMRERVPRMRARMDELERLGMWVAPASVSALAEHALALDPPTPRCVVHGDLHVRQTLVRGGELTGVIDWIDICRSDPAIDLVQMWTLGDQQARRAFTEAYGEVDHAAEIRSRVLALDLSGILAIYGRHHGMPRLEAEALAGLNQSCT